MRSDYYDELVRRNDILAVAQELGLAVRGAKCRCLRPEAHAHGDRTPSVSLNRRRNTFNCWVCPNVRGSVIDLVMLARGIPRDQAVAYLAARVGMEPPAARRGTTDHRPQTTDRRPQTRDPRPETRDPRPQTTDHGPQTGMAGVRGTIDRAAVREEPAAWALVPPEVTPHVGPALELDEERVHRIYSFFLRWCDRVGSRGYLSRHRGISRATADRMGIVWVHAPKQVEQRLRDEFPEEELLASGVLNEWGLIFRHHRIVFPFERRGRVRFLQGRCTDGREPKYLSVRRPICCLYNHDVLETLPPESPVVLSEGVLDTLTWLDRGVPAVGVLGVGTFKLDWMEDFRGRRVIISFDNDEPGLRAARSLRERFRAAGHQAHTVALPEGVNDVNELFLRYPDLDGRSVIP